MPKKLVLCLDGTNNKFKKDNTNVVKLLALLDKRATDQLVYYQPGIGTMTPPGVYGHIRQWFLTRIDLAFATLLKYHVEDAYRFLMRYYEEGDEIFLFGFSRGAYTARVLAGMLCKVGLLAKGNEEMVSFAWEMYAGENNSDQAKKFRNTFSRKVPITFLGVWDTVSSVRWASFKYVLGKQMSFPHTMDNPMVRKVRHAIALDERRAYFRQNLWTDKPEEGQDVLQVWFPGVHCDVGGGYEEKESGLSKIALKWMVDEIGAALVFHPVAVAKMIPQTSTVDFAAPDRAAKIHESLKGLWKIVEWIPKRIKDRQQNYAYRWILPRGRSRWVAGDANIHPSAFERMKAGVGYYPRNLPSQNPH